ncbi:MAG: radical SAM protein [Candidatus Nanoarchaeia archaeon]|nr:radical SAM protein [Candidatus Nanoarchaeia archaeon]
MIPKVIRFFRFLKNYQKNKKKTFPDVVNYDITSKCNLKCEHCYWWKTRATKELTDKEWEKVFKEHVEKGAVMGYLTGGEPTLRINVIRTAYNIFNSIGIVSNGTRKIPEEIQCRIFVSIDGPKEIHNKIRGVDVFDKVIENIKNDKRVVLTPTLSATNYKYIDDMVDIARKSGVEGITFSTYTCHGTEDDLYLKGEQLEWTVNKLLEVWKKNKDIVFLTPFIIKSFLKKEYTDYCYFRGKKFIAFDSSMNRKLPCTLGKGVNCNTCGCIVPVVAYALRKGDVRTWFLFDKLYPEKYDIKKQVEV